MPTTALKQKRTSWKDEYYVRVYELRRSGFTSRANVARAMGVSTDCMKDWFKKKPALRDAWERACKKSDTNFSFKDYVHDRLPPGLQKVWDDMEACGDTQSDLLRLGEIYGGQTKKARQRLFFYALVNSNFSTTEALRRCNIPRATLRDWVLNDPDFEDLLHELDEAKKDMFEGSLIDLVQQRDTAATIFANKTINKDRGYGDQKTVEIKGAVQHNHAMLSIDDLDLPLEIRQAILEAWRVKELKDRGGVVEGKLIASVGG